MERYNYIKSLYKKKGRNHRIYYHGKSKKLKDYTDSELSSLYVHFKSCVELLKKSELDVYIANYEIVQDYIIKRRIEKIKKIKNKIKFKRFFKL